MVGENNRVTTGKYKSRGDMICRCEMKDILCFGDSNTYGLIPGTRDRYGRSERWTGILAENVKDRGYSVVEEGLCGRTTVFDDPNRYGRRGTELLPAILESHAPIDTAIVMLGTNDCKNYIDASAETIGQGVKKVVNQIRSFDDKIKILLISPIFLGDDVYDGYDSEFNEKSVEVSKGLGDVYKKIADEENLYFLRASDYAKPSDADREHLDKEGHKSLAAAVTGVINKL